MKTAMKWSARVVLAWVLALVLAAASSAAVSPSDPGIDLVSRSHVATTAGPGPSEGTNWTAIGAGVGGAAVLVAAGSVVVSVRHGGRHGPHRPVLTH